MSSKVKILPITDQTTICFSLREYPQEVIDYVTDQLPDRLGSGELNDIIAESVNLGDLIDTDEASSHGVIVVKNLVLELIEQIIAEKQADMNCKSERAETTGEDA